MRRGDIRHWHRQLELERTEEDEQKRLHLCERETVADAVMPAAEEAKEVCPHAGDSACGSRDGIPSVGAT
jgi:hypothetical protein